MKEIVNYEGLYEISLDGEIKSLGRYVKHSSGNGECFRKPRILKQSINSRGYKVVTLFDKDGKRKMWGVHMLMAMTFLNHTPDGTHKLVVDHKDNNRLNNQLDNLQIITGRENTSKDRKGGTSKYVGVSWYKKTSKWVSYIHLDGKKRFIGYFDDEQEAHLAYQKELNKYTFR
ncbi:HNH endonuclease [Candidatus Babeliales bacterium]|nr:HNH endonuclease [Candidatus Babeliales bacterium]